MNDQELIRLLNLRMQDIQRGKASDDFKLGYKMAVFYATKLAKNINYHEKKGGKNGSDK